MPKHEAKTQTNQKLNKMSETNFTPGPWKVNPKAKMHVTKDFIDGKIEWHKLIMMFSSLGQYKDFRHYNYNKLEAIVDEIDELKCAINEIKNTQLKIFRCDTH